MNNNKTLPKTFTIGHSTIEHQSTHANNVHRSANKYGQDKEEIASLDSGYNEFKSEVFNAINTVIKPFLESKTVNLLAIGCRSFHELDFLEYVLEKSFSNSTTVEGVELFNVFNDERITIDNAENFKNTKNKNKNFNIIYSDNNLEHLIDPVSHFKNLINIVDDEFYLFYVLPCWNDMHAKPTMGHPNLIHCTKTYEDFAVHNINEYLNEMFLLAKIDKKIEFEVIHTSINKLLANCSFIVKVKKQG